MFENRRRFTLDFAILFSVRKGALEQRQGKIGTEVGKVPTFPYLCSYLFIPSFQKPSEEGISMVTFF